MSTFDAFYFPPIWARLEHIALTFGAMLKTQVLRVCRTWRFFIREQPVNPRQMPSIVFCLFLLALMSSPSAVLAQEPAPPPIGTGADPPASTATAISPTPVRSETAVSSPFANPTRTSAPTPPATRLPLTTRISDWPTSILQFSQSNPSAVAGAGAVLFFILLLTIVFSRSRRHRVAAPAPSQPLVSSGVNLEGAPVSSSGPDLSREEVTPDKTTSRLLPKGFSALPIHAVVGQRYKVIQTLTTQPDANTYLVSSTRSRRQWLLYESASPTQFDGEQRWIASQWRHPALVEMEDAFQVSYEDHTRAYLAVEFPLTPATVLSGCSECLVLEQGMQLAEVLALAHDHGLASGNIRPGSIFLSDHQIKLWGSALPTPLTPELRALDVYHLAGALYRLATPPGASAPAFSPSAMRVFARALSPDPHSRYPDARAFCAGLQRVVQHASHRNVTTMVGRLSDAGRIREIDEDALLTMEISHYTDAGSQTLGLYAVADGMGGESEGQVASRQITETLAREVNRLVLAARPSSVGKPTDYRAILLAAAQQANLDVYNARQQAGNRMGSTLVAALLVGFQAHVANVGDSRAYLVSADKIEKLTKDHSLVQALLDRQVIGEAERRAHPQRNYITRSMGDKPRVDVDIFSAVLEPGQYLLLCCDGLWEMVEDEQIHRTVVRANNPQEACRQLIDAANANGGDDNITCVLVHVEDADAGAQ